MKKEKKAKKGVEVYRGLKCGEEEAHFTTRVMGLEVRIDDVYTLFLGRDLLE